MEGKKLVVVVGTIDVVMLVICLIIYLGKDRKGPEIFFDEVNQIEYEEGLDENLLLEGVTAVDEKDGDVSDSLLVEKVTGTNGREVIVTYVARDSTNNVGKASRSFTVASRYGGGEALEEENGIIETGDIVETENTTEAKLETEKQSSEESNQPTEEERQEENQQKENEKEKEHANSNPVLVLNSDIIETKKGSAPNWNEVIELMSDDKDDYNKLYNNLKLEGQVKLNEAGEYPVMLYTVDTDGNRSEVRSLVVKVK